MKDWAQCHNFDFRPKILSGCLLNAIRDIDNIILHIFRQNQQRVVNGVFESRLTNIIQAFLLENSTMRYFSALWFATRLRKAT